MEIKINTETKTITVYANTKLGDVIDFLEKHVDGWREFTLTCLCDYHPVPITYPVIQPYYVPEPYPVYPTIPYPLPTYPYYPVTC